MPPRSARFAADPLSPLPAAFFRRPADRVARDLLGRYLVRELEGQRMVLRLVETEAYLGQPDRASHAWAGRRTARNESLYRPGGCAYVYFIYGMHYCLNAVTGRAEIGSAVLLRAGEAVEGTAAMQANRRLQGRLRPGAVAGGPGKLCQALRIDRALDGHPLDAPPLFLATGQPVGRRDVVAGPRVGIDYAGEATSWPLRFALREHPEVSRPRPGR
jgi:DNA-3-methyladenine glycosylase